MNTETLHTEDELIEMYQSHEITMVEFISLHSSEWSEEYREFCKGQDMETNEASAEAFLDYKGAQLEEAMDGGDA